ncbi:MAG: hypothetical protein CMN78_02550 [Spirochaetales bacterium]|nr:hypothetical protein [Spirochaetales bacterium]
MTSVKKWMQLCFLCCALGANADTLEELFATAIENDNQLEILTLSETNTRLVIEKRDLPKRIKIVAGANDSRDGLVTLYQTFSDTPSTSVVLDPYVTVTLGENIETAIGVSTDIDFGLEEDNEFAFKPVFTVSQPINPLIGLEPSDDSTKIGDSLSFFQASLNRENRVRSLKKTVIDKIKAVLNLEKSIGDAQRSAELARDALARENTIGTLNRESLEYKRLESAVVRGDQALETLTLQRRLSWQELEGLVGDTVAELPSDFQAVSLEIASSYDINSHPGVQTSRLGVERAEANLEEVLERFIPTYTVGASYDLDGQQIGTSFSTGFKNLTMSLWIAGDIDDQSLSAQFGINWSLPDNRAEKIGDMEAANALEIARLQLEDKIRNTENAVALLRISVLGIEYRGNELSTSKEIADLELVEKQKQLEVGMATKTEVANAQWNVEKLRIDERVLRLDALKFALDIEGLESAESQ